MKNLILTDEQKKAISQIIELHESMKNSYFWAPPKSASDRRTYEKKHSATVDFTSADGTIIHLECVTKCTCHNIYYKSYFFINREKVSIRKVKDLIK